MRRSLALASVTAFGLALGACSAENPNAPDAQSTARSTPTMSMTLPATSQAPTRYIVAFNGHAPSKLESSVADLGGSVDAVYEKYGFAVVSGIDDEGAAQLGSLNGVTEAGAEPMFTLDEPMTNGALAGTAPASAAQPSTAFFFPIQWHLGVIGAPEAWAAGRLGSSDVTVAVLDTGIDPTHFDLAGRVDLANSAVFDHTDDFYIDLYWPGADYIVDINFHGTHVASTISSNALVTAGVTSQTTLMAVKVCNVFSSCPGAAIFEGFAYAIDHGADVINMSLGGSFDKSGAKGFGSVINRLFNAAKRAGVTVVVSAGNDAADLDHNGSVFATYCDAPHVLCVSATGPGASTDQLYGPWSDFGTPTSYTNFGRSAISVAAPGGEPGIGWVGSACSSYSLLTSCPGGTYILWVAGTSQAAPQVSGLAALLVEDYGRSPSRIAAAIRKGAVDLGQKGTDPYFGKGQINIPNSLGID